jgi:bis(5'-adenosyl)-triphosphatase
VIPKRNTPRLEDLNKEETVDLMLSAQTIGQVLEKHYACTSLTMTIQDGPQAGQTVNIDHIIVLFTIDSMILIIRSLMFIYM